MAFANANSAALVAGAPKISAAITGGKERVALSEFTLASDVAGTYTSPELAFPIGARILDVQINSSVSLGSSTIALGITGTVGKYRAAATFTSTDQWVQANLNAAVGVVLTAAERWILTVATATLPASGRLLIKVTWVDPS